MADVYALVIWLKESGLIPLETSQLSADAGDVPEGHKSFVFNPPALPRVHYAHYATREEAEAGLRELCTAIDAGKTTVVAMRNTTFAVPAHSVHYVALGKGEAGRTNPGTEPDVPGDAQSQ